MASRRSDYTPLAGFGPKFFRLSIGSPFSRQGCRLRAKQNSQSAYFPIVEFDTPPSSVPFDAEFAPPGQNSNRPGANARFAPPSFRIQGSRPHRVVRQPCAVTQGEFSRTLELPQEIEKWSLTSLQQRLVKTGGRLVRHARHYWLLLAESHLNRRLFASMLGRIDRLPLPSG